MAVCKCAQVRAGLQTLEPKEKKFIEPEVKFSRHTFVRNVVRVKGFIVDMIEAGKFIEYVLVCIIDSIRDTIRKPSLSNRS